MAPFPGGQTQDDRNVHGEEKQEYEEHEENEIHAVTATMADEPNGNNEINGDRNRRLHSGESDEHILQARPLPQALRELQAPQGIAGAASRREARVLADANGARKHDPGGVDGGGGDEIGSAAAKPCACARYIGEFGAAPVERGYWFKDETVGSARTRIDALCGNIYRLRQEGRTAVTGAEGYERYRYMI